MPLSARKQAGTVEVVADLTFTTVQDDEVLEQAWRAGVAAGLGELFRRHHRGLVSYVARIVRDVAAAEDLASQAFVRVLERREGQGRFRSLLFTVARNLALNEVRRQGRQYAARPGLEVEPTSAAAGPLERLVRGEDEAAFTRAAATLTDEERRCFVLKEAHGLTYPEIGQALGLHPDAARRRVAKAYERLRAELGNAQGDAR